MGAIETAMIDASYAQVGKSLGLPTHTYLGASDAKIVDAQAGLESGMTALVGALAGINMISGAGMLDFLACQSAEKLVMTPRQSPWCSVCWQCRCTPRPRHRLFAGINFKADFLKRKPPPALSLWCTCPRQPSTALAALRQGRAGWMRSAGRRTASELLDAYQPPQHDPAQARAHALVAGLPRRVW
jgi:trimethylamine--corrinoid protein Co-methyltransferase